MTDSGNSRDATGPITVNAFRCLVLASFVLDLGAGFVDALVPSLIPPALSSAAEAESLPGASDPIWLQSLLVIWGAALLVATFGILFFKAWARSLCLWLTIAGLGFYGVLGASVSSGLANALTEAAMTLWGAALAVAYFSPLRERFSRNIDLG